MRKMQPHRVVLHKKINEFETEIDFGHELSDGFGIPAVVINCPIEKKFKKYKGFDEYGEKVEGISFDDCMDCPYFGGLGSGQEILCFYRNKLKNESKTRKYNAFSVGSGKTDLSYRR